MRIDALVVQGIILIVGIEAVVFVVWRWWTGRGPKPGDILWNLGAGAALLAALVTALRGSSDAWLAGWLLLAGIAHIADAWRRVKASARGTGR